MANDIYRFNCEWSLPNGSVGQNILYAEILGGAGAVQDDLIDDIGIEMVRIFSPWFGAVTNNTILTRVSIYEFDALTGLSVPVGTKVLGNTGVASGDPLPGGCAIKVNLFVQGRSRPAGMFLPAPAVLGVGATGTLDASFALGAVGVGVDATAAATLGTTGLPYVPHFYSDKDNVMVNLVGASTQVDTTVDYMRSRKRGNGI